MITWSEYNQRVQRDVSSMPTLRVGQVFYNVLRDTRPTLAGVVRDSEVDPFYADERIPRFLSFIRDRWSQSSPGPGTCTN